MAIVRVEKVGLLVVEMKTVEQDATDGVSRIDKIALTGSEHNYSLYISCYTEILFTNLQPQDCGGAKISVILTFLPSLVALGRHG